MFLSSVAVPSYMSSTYVPARMNSFSLYNIDLLVHAVQYRIYSILIELDLLYIAKSHE
jgi:hypothetical protein